MEQLKQNFKAQNESQSKLPSFKTALKAAILAVGVLLPAKGLMSQTFSSGGLSSYWQNPMQRSYEVASEGRVGSLYVTPGLGLQAASEEKLSLENLQDIINDAQRFNASDQAVIYRDFLIKTYEDRINKTQARKMIDELVANGQIKIVRDGKTYTLVPDTDAVTGDSIGEYARTNPKTDRVILSQSTKQTYFRVGMELFGGTRKYRDNSEYNANRLPYANEYQTEDILQGGGMLYMNFNPVNWKYAPMFLTQVYGGYLRFNEPIERANPETASGQEINNVKSQSARALQTTHSYFYGIVLQTRNYNVGQNKYLGKFDAYGAIELSQNFFKISDNLDETDSAKTLDALIKKEVQAQSEGKAMWNGYNGHYNVKMGVDNDTLFRNMVFGIGRQQQIWQYQNTRLNHNNYNFHLTDPGYKWLKPMYENVVSFGLGYGHSVLVSEVFQGSDVVNALPRSTGRLPEEMRAAEFMAQFHTRRLFKLDRINDPWLYLLVPVEVNASYRRQWVGQPYTINAWSVGMQWGGNNIKASLDYAREYRSNASGENDKIGQDEQIKLGVSYGF